MNILEYIKKYRLVRIRDVAKEFGVTWYAARYQLEKLVEQGVVSKEGRGIYEYIGDILNEEIALSKPQSIDEKVLNLFSDGVPRKPIDVVRVLRIKKTTARAVVNRLYTNGELKRLPTGYYVHKNYEIIHKGLKKKRKVKKEVTEKGIKKIVNEEEIPIQYTMPRFGFHGIKLEYRDGNWCDKNRKFCVEILGGSYLHTHPSPLRHRHPKNHSIVQQDYITLEGEEVPITITLHKHLIEVWIKNSEHPIGIDGFNELVGWLKGVFAPLTERQWKLVQIGVNEDLKELKVDGMSDITLKEYRNMLFRIYNKHGIGLRKEFHIAMGEEEKVSLREAMDLFKNYDADRLIGAIQEVKKLQEQVIESSKKTGEMLNALTAYQVEVSKLLMTHIKHYEEEKQQLIGAIESINKILGVIATGEVKSSMQTQPEDDNKEDTTYIG